MSSSVKLNHLTIEAFRGLSDRLEFDFRSPITLLYAANGTGKTSVCDAAEWLLTGQVDRLRDGQHFDPSVLTPKFPSGKIEPTVVGEIDGVTQFTLTRTFEGSSVLEDQSSVQIALGNLLERLAPSAAADDLHHTAAIHLRQNWLRGTHFLSIEALSALIDTDSSTIERRKQIFADLLGIRMYLDACKELEKYRAEVAPEEKRLSEEADALRERVAAQDRLIQAFENRPGTLANELRRAEETLTGKSTVNRNVSLIDAGRTIARLSADHARQLNAHNSERAVLATLESIWPERTNLNKSLSDLSSNEGALRAKLKHVMDTLKSIAAVKSNLEAQLAEQQMERHIVAAGFDALSQKAAEMRSVVRMRPNQASSSFQDLVHTIPDSLRRERTRREHRRIISGLKNQASIVAKNSRRVIELRKDLEKARHELPSKKELDDLTRQLSEARIKVSETQRRLDEIKAPTERIRSAGAEFIAHPDHIRGADCPLCGHNWKTGRELQSAIRKALNALPAIIKAMTEEATVATKLCSSLEKSHERVVATQFRVRSLETEINSLSLSIDGFRKDMQSIGLSAEPIDAINIIEAHENLLALADVVSGLQSELREQSEVLKKVNLSGTIVQESAVAKLVQLFDEQSNAVVKEIDNNIAAVSAELEEKSQAEVSHRRQFNRTQVELNECLSSIEKLRTQINRIRENWELLASGKPMGDENLKEVRTRISARFAHLNTASGLLAGARAVLQFEQRVAELQDTKVRLEYVASKASKLRSRLDAGAEAIKILTSYYTDQSREEVHRLGRVVNVLFSRMHANRVVDFIDLGVDSDFLRWFASAGAEQFNPQKEFSQGQRQDLALAIFLARARGFGGTFFLDEPMMHFDDLNRVGLLDVLRAIAIQSHAKMSLIITTANRAFARHMIEKFSRLGTVNLKGEAIPMLRVIELSGNARLGVTTNVIFPALKAVAVA